MNIRYQGFTLISSLFLSVVVALLLCLGFWQIARMNEKQAQLEQIDKVASDTALTLTQVLDRLEHEPIQSGTRVSINAQVNTGRIWLLDNQIHEKKIGYKVLAEVETVKGPLLADFGWIEAKADRQEFPLVELPRELSNVEAVITYPSKNAFVDNSYTETKVIDGLEISRVQAIDNNDLFVLVLLQESAQFKRFWVPIVMPPEKHLAYAIQWFGLALAAGVIGFISLRNT